MANRLREALLDAIEARDEAIKDAADVGAEMARRALAGVVVRAAKAGATEEDVRAAMIAPEAERAIKLALLRAAMVAEAHAGKHASLLRGAGKGRDDGPVRREHIDARRAARKGG